MAIGGGNNISGMVAGIQGDMSNMSGWLSSQWGTMARTPLSQASQLSDGASKMLAQLKDNTISDFSKMDASAIGYWNDIADYIAGHSINGNITYTAKSIGGQTVVNGQYQATGAPPGGQTKMSAEGWLNSPGGWSWVGERGAELMNVPRGASIFPHNQSVGMASSGGASSGRPVVIQFVVNGRQLANAALPDFVEAIRDHTGAKF